MPEPAPRAMPAGCWVAGGIYLGACALWLVAAPNPLTIALALPAGAVIAAALFRRRTGLVLRDRVRAEWMSRGVRCLVVHSQSPRWSERIASRWLPRLGERAVMLDWSERANWEDSLEVRVFKHWCGERNFNPAVVVFREGSDPLVFRFFWAFQEAKGGRRQYLDELEEAMFRAVQN